jgi:peptidoglycan hydrolase CwlO-like protein
MNQEEKSKILEALHDETGDLITILVRGVIILTQRYVKSEQEMAEIKQQLKKLRRLGTNYKAIQKEIDHLLDRLDPPQKP